VACPAHRALCDSIRRLLRVAGRAAIDTWPVRASDSSGWRFDDTEATEPDAGVCTARKRHRRQRGFAAYFFCLLI
jgi:hypothetical protein|tara:strand:- start:1211 stop:1435 length:225 start_codon:yes stop_codon:yes gene_type:complete